MVKKQLNFYYKFINYYKILIIKIKGLTVEIGNTDAEGRLCLADAMTWTSETHKPSELLELSTLTGACMVALGEQSAGIFTNDETLANQLIDCGAKNDEILWKMPIFKEHRKALKSDFADLNNVGKGRYGGACVAAAFLENFVEKGTKWAHIDIAGPADTKKDSGVWRPGATGFGVQTLMEYLKGKGNQA